MIRGSFIDIAFCCERARREILTLASVFLKIIFGRLYTSKHTVINVCLYMYMPCVPMRELFAYMYAYYVRVWNYFRLNINVRNSLNFCGLFLRICAYMRVGSCCFFYGKFIEKFFSCVLRVTFTRRAFLSSIVFCIVNLLVFFSAVI